MIKKFECEDVRFFITIKDLVHCFDRLNYIEDGFIAQIEHPKLKKERERLEDDENLYVKPEYVIFEKNENDNWQLVTNLIIIDNYAE